MDYFNQGDWVHVVADGRTGYVSEIQSQYVIVNVDGMLIGFKPDELASPIATKSPRADRMAQHIARGKRS